MPKYAANPLAGWNASCQKSVVIDPPALRCATSGTCARSWTSPTATGGLHVSYTHAAGQLGPHNPAGFTILMPLSAGTVSGGFWNTTLHITDSRGTSEDLPIQSDQPPDNCTGLRAARRLVRDRSRGRRRQRKLRHTS